MWSRIKNLLSVKCPNCSLPIKKADNFCPHCGIKTPFGRNTCVQCRFSIEKEDQFCRNCGENLTIIKVTENVIPGNIGWKDKL